MKLKMAILFVLFLAVCFSTASLEPQIAAVMLDYDDCATEARLLYIGKARAEDQLQTSSHVWQIQKIFYVTDVDCDTTIDKIAFANGSSKFNYRWDQRTLYTYE